MDKSTQATTPPWLNLENLIDFIDGLREAGYNIGVSQYVAAQDVILALTAKGEKLDQPQRLGSLLGPLLCSSPQEQEDFKSRFNQWVAHLAIPLDDTEQDKRAEAVQHELSELEKRSRPLKWIAFGGIIVIAVIVLVLVRLYIPLVAHETTEEIAPQLEELTNTEEPSNLPDQSTVIWILGIAGTLTLPFIFWRGWLYYRARLFLKRHATTHQPEIDQISVRMLDDQLFSSLSLLQTAQKFRRRIEIPSNVLDLDQTITLSVANAGWFTPVYGHHQVIPEYLVLIDWANYGDHKAQFVKGLIEQLAKDGVFITGYYFDGDPRLCFPMDNKGGPLILNEAALKFSQHRLLMFTDGDSLINPWTGRLASWTNQFENWSERAIFTPEPMTHWGYQEQELSQLFTLLPSTANGLAMFIQNIHQDKLSQHPGNGTRAPIPEVLRFRPRRWLENHPPEPAQLEEILNALRRLLGRAGYYWLSACAVYPEINWNITLYLGDTLQSEDGSKLLDLSRLTTLARLPWFRHSYMPDWLRSRLISELSDTQEHSIRTTLTALLVTSVQGSPASFQLEIAKEHSSILSELVKPIFRSLSKQAPDNSALKEHVFNTFMSDPLSVRIPRTLRNLFSTSYPTLAFETFEAANVRQIPVIGFGRRAVAYVIDYIVLAIIKFGINLIIGLVGAGLDPNISDSFILISFLLTYLVYGAYAVMFWVKAGGQTPGKMVMRIKVIGVDGRPLSWGKAIGRYLARIISTYALLLGLIWAAFDHKRQGWHDKLARTYVVPKDINFLPTEPITIVPDDDVNITPKELASVQVAGFGRRVVAYIIDNFILLIILIVALFIIGLLGPVVGDTVGGILALLVYLISPVYAVVFWVKAGGQTPGKMVMRIKVISVDGRPLSWGKAIGRYLARLVSSLVLYLGFIWATFDPNRQGWHDKLAKTYVVSKDTHFSSTDAVTAAPSDTMNTGRNIAIILLSAIPILCLVAIVVIAILLLLGPVVGNVFSNIVENLEITPTPIP